MINFPAQSAGCRPHRCRRGLRSHTLALLGALSLAGALIAAAPQTARAVGFTDFETWDLSPDGNEYPNVTINLSGTGFTLQSSSEATNTFTSGIAADQDYVISFNFDTTIITSITEDPEFFYQINSNPEQTFSGDGSLPNTANKIIVLEGQFFRFGINTNGGDGDLIITNFNATAVPSPLPIAGLGLAALGIYRARRRKSTAIPK